MFKPRKVSPWSYEGEIYAEKCLEFDNLKFMYDALNRGYRNIEQRLARLIEENQQLKIRLGGNKTNCQVLKEDLDMGC